MKGKGATRLKTKAPLNLSVAGWIKPISIGITVSSIMFAVIILVLQVANNEVEKLELVGSFEYVKKQDVLNQLEGVYPQGYVALDVQEIYERLIEMPMISSVDVEKIWPDTLKINVHEEQPIAIWNKSSLLSQAGDILPVSFENLALPSLEGSGDSSRLVMQHYQLFNKWCKRHGLNLVGLTKSTSGWLIQEQTGLKIWLDGANAMSGLRQLESVIDQFQFTRISSIDLRYEQGFAVAWKEKSAKVQG